jgi:hypothetical protein
MSGSEFYRTKAGRTFYERDVPRIAEALDRVAEALEVISDKLTYRDELERSANTCVLYSHLKEKESKRNIDE